MEAAFGDEKRQFFGETRRFSKGVPKGTAKESNKVSLKKWPFLVQRVASKHALNGCQQGAPVS